MYKIIKYIIDLILSLFVLIILSPFLLLTSIVIYTTMGSPILFKQKRPGLNGEIFTFYKFRTMVNKESVKSEFVSDVDRLTFIGSFLRNNSLDELPSLINVIRGEMSLVGPRPLLPEYLPLYSKFQARRHEVKPGITGWAQVNGRNAIKWGKKFELDVWYVDNRTFFLDIKILFMTISTVFRKKGIDQTPFITMEKFKGNN